MTATSEMGKAAISLTTGLEDAEKVTVALLVAVGAAESGRPTVLFLTKEAVRLALEGVAVGSACEPCPSLPELLDRYEKAGGRPAGLPHLLQGQAARRDPPRGQRGTRRNGAALGVGRVGGHDLQLLTPAPVSIRLARARRLTAGAAEVGNAPAKPLRSPCDHRPGRAVSQHHQRHQGGRHRRTAPRCSSHLSNDTLGYLAESFRTGSGPGSSQGTSRSGRWCPAPCSYNYRAPSGYKGGRSWRSVFGSCATT